MTTAPTITPEAAAHVLFHYGRDGGYQAGSFTTSLLYTIDLADETNRDKLAQAFPEYVAAVIAIQYDRDGVTRLQEIVQGLRCIRCGDTDGPFAGAPQQPLCEGCYALPVIVQ